MDEADRGALIHPALEYYFLNDPLVYTALLDFLHGRCDQKTAYAAAYSLLVQACKEYVEKLNEYNFSTEILIVPWVEGMLEEQAAIVAKQAHIKRILRETLEKVITWKTPPPPFKPW